MMLKRKSRDIKHGAGPYALPARERWGSITGTQWSLLLVLEEVATLSDEYVCVVQASPLGQEDPLEKGTAPHSRSLVYKGPWTEEPSRLQTKVLQRIGHS